MASRLPRIIAICGKKRCGKDTLAEHIADHYGYQHVKIASQLKEAMKVLFGFTDTQLESDDKDVIDPRWNITPRRAMQYIGTEVMQYEIQKLLPDVGRGFWIQGMLERHGHKNLVISDLRFLHEYAALKKRYGTELFVVKLQRKNIIAVTSSDLHVSELEFERIAADVELDNNGSVTELHNMFDDALNMQVRK